MSAGSARWPVDGAAVRTAPRSAGTHALPSCRDMAQGLSQRKFPASSVLPDPWYFATWG